MSKLDKIKTIIDFLKGIINTLIVVLFGMVGYVFINANTLNTTQLILVGVSILFDIIALILLGRITVNKINEIEEL